MSRDDVEKLRDAYAAFNEGGVEAIMERLGPAFQVRDRQTAPDRQTRYGQGGIKQLFDSYMEAFDALRSDGPSLAGACGWSRPSCPAESP